MAVSSSQGIEETIRRLRDQIQQNDSVAITARRALVTHHQRFLGSLRHLFSCSAEDVISSVRNDMPYVYEELKKDPVSFLQHQLSLDQDTAVGEQVAGVLRQHLSEWEGFLSGLRTHLDQPKPEEMASLKRRRSRIRM